MIIEQEVFTNLNFELGKLHEKIEVIKKRFKRSNNTIVFKKDYLFLFSKALHSN